MCARIEARMRTGAGVLRMEAGAGAADGKQIERKQVRSHVEGWVDAGWGGERQDTLNRCAHMTIESGVGSAALRTRAGAGG